MQRKIYVDNIDRDEMRWGFLVTSHRKKLWNVQLNLIVEFARICQKHNLKWFVSGGSLLGAVRHQGFVPWDDDVDIMMFRPDYERLKQIAPTELDPTYILDYWYNYVQEGEANPDGLPVIKREQLEKYPWLPFSPLLKIRDPRTTFLKYPEYDNLIQCIWIDVFPLDPVPPFDDPEHEKIFWAGNEIRIAVTYPDQLRAAIERGDQFIHSRDRLKELLSMPFRTRALEYEKYLADNFFASKYVDFVTFYMISEEKVNRIPPLETKQHDDLIELPFERITVPAPAGYDNLLTTQYGDWRTPVRTHSHAKVYSADISYKEYFAAQFAR